MKKYLIFTHDYKRQSAGVRALHKLCHYLNLAGCEAYVTSEVRNPAWNTPLATPEQQAEIVAHGIVVYPEVERGNQLQAAQVVRYILNIPGLIRGDTSFPPTEQLFAYSGLLRYYVHNPLNVLTVPVVDLDIFNPVGRASMDEVQAFWVGKGVGTPRIPETDAAVEITFDWPSTWRALAALFKSAAHFISYADYTMLTIEARLCGCPTIIIPTGNFSREAFARAMPGINGLAWGMDAAEIYRAKHTVGQFWYDYQESVAQFYVQLERFIDKTQRWVE